MLLCQGFSVVVAGPRASLPDCWDGGGGSHEQSPPSNPSKAASPKDPGPGPGPRQLSDVNAFLPRPHGAALAAGLGGVVGQGWGCSMVAVGDIGESVPRAGCP